jgi:hypothetical protein
MRWRHPALFAIFILIIGGIALGSAGYILFHRTGMGKILLQGPGYICAEEAKRICPQGVKAGDFSGNWLNYSCRFECK